MPIIERHCRGGVSIVACIATRPEREGSPWIRRHWRLRIQPRFSAWPIARIVHDAIQLWVKDMSAAGLGPRTVRWTHTVLKMTVSAVRSISARTWAICVRAASRPVPAHTDFRQSRAKSSAPGDVSRGDRSQHPDVSGPHRLAHREQLSPGHRLRDAT